MLRWYPRRDSNPRFRLRRPALYPTELRGLLTAMLFHLCHAPQGAVLVQHNPHPCSIYIGSHCWHTVVVTHFANYKNLP